MAMKDPVGGLHKMTGTTRRVKKKNVKRELSNTAQGINKQAKRVRRLKSAVCGCLGKAKGTGAKYGKKAVQEGDRRGGGTGL